MKAPNRDCARSQILIHLNMAMAETSPVSQELVGNIEGFRKKMKWETKDGSPLRWTSGDTLKHVLDQLRIP
jgi:hypothetical protein